MKKRSEYWWEVSEVIIGVVVAIIFGLLDWSTQSAKTPWIAALHAPLHSLLLSTVATSSLFLLIRWHRHREELFGSFIAHRAELLDEIGSFKHTCAIPEIQNKLSSITRAVATISNNDWPSHSTKYLLEQLSTIDVMLNSFASGTFKLSMPNALVHELEYFKQTSGSVFITHYGDVRHLTKETGNQILLASKQTIYNGGKILRVFILPPYPADVQFMKVNTNPEYINLLSAIIYDQLSSGISIKIISGRSLESRLIKDIAIYCKTHDQHDIDFVSEWLPTPHHDPLDNRTLAQWHFNPDQMQIFTSIKDELILRSDEIVIPTDGQDAIDALKAKIKSYRVSGK